MLWKIPAISMKNKWPHRLRLARTPAFHAGKPGSTPGGVTKWQATKRKLG